MPNGIQFFCPHLKCTTWQGCYSSGWEHGDIIDTAFSHPAKYSKQLIFRIIQYLIRERYIEKGEGVLDPFGGVGLGTLPCMSYGLRWTGVELESRFVAVAQQNLDLWRQRYGFTGATILQGDSRRLREVLGEAQGCVAVGSPPYIDRGVPDARGLHFDSQRAPDGRTRREASITTKQHMGVKDGYADETPGQLGALKPGTLADVVCSSPPYAEGLSKDHTYSDHAKRDNASHRCIMAEKGIADPFYGTSEGQLGTLKAGDFEAVISSPPFAQSTQTNHNPADMTAGKAVWKDGHDSAARVKQDYAPLDTPGNLAGLPVGDCVVSSPPFENSLPSGETASEMKARWGTCQLGGAWGQSYGTDAAQLGSASHGTFWGSASMIMAEVAAVLKPGGVACWVLKGYIAKGKYVDFPAQWRQLCEAHGFILLEEIHASLVEHLGTQENLFQPAEEITISRKSFFRRLAEKRGSPSINHETILILRKQADEEAMPRMWT